MIKRNIFIVLLISLSISLILLYINVYFSNFNLPKSCTTPFILKFQNGNSSVLSSGQFYFSFDKDLTAIGVYNGNIFFNIEGKTKYSKKVNRSIALSYSIKNNILITKTINVTVNTNDNATEDDVVKYITPAFEVGTIIYHPIIRIASNRYATGDGKYPKVICLPD